MNALRTGIRDLLVFACVVFAPISLAQEKKEPDPAAIVKRSIRVLGGRAKIAELDVSYARRTVKGDTSEAIAESWRDLSRDCRKLVLTGVNKGTRFRMVSVFDGVNGWHKLNNDATKPLPENSSSGDEQFEAVYLSRQLYPLFEDKEIRLTIQKREASATRTLDFVRAFDNKEIDLILAFDRETGLVVRCTYQASAGAYKDKKIEHIFGEYKDFDGLKYAVANEMRVDGKFLVRDRLLELKRVKEFPKGTFARPE